MIRAELPPEMISTYGSPITPEETYHAITSGRKNRAPGRDGISLEFYKTAWPLIGDENSRIINSIF
jgi:hypothetical protein